jgi:HlyD family secretion protein
MSPQPKLVPVAPAPGPKPHLVAKSRPKRSFTGVWILLTIVLICGAAWLAYQRSAAGKMRSAAAAEVRTLKVSGGAAGPVLRVTGSTSARVYASIKAPVMMGPDAGRGMLMKYITKSGSVVKAGEVIARIDDQAIRDHADDVQAQITQLDDTIKRRRADQTIELENWKQSILSAKGVWDKAKLDYSAKDIRTDVDREVLKLDMDEAEANYKNLVKAMAITEEKFKSQLTLLRWQRERQVRHHDRHVRDAENFTIKAPIDGLLVLNTIFRGGDFAQVQEGDQLSPGQPFGKVVDIRTMQVDSSVNQAESQMVRIGQVAKVHLDAFPSMEFSGKVIGMGALGVSGGRNGYFVRQVPLQILIDGSDPRLIPDLSASADLQTAPAEKGVLVPLEAVSTTPKGDVVEVRRGSGWTSVAVNVGSRTNTVAVITSGLRQGDEVVLARP